MPIENQSYNSRAQKGAPNHIKRNRSNSETVTISLKPSKSYESNNNTRLFNKMSQTFSQYRHYLTNDKKNALLETKRSNGRKLSIVEEKALSEYGVHLSEKKQDHQAAIVTLMRALKSQSTNGVLNVDGAQTLTYMGNAYMRRAESSTGENAMKDAKRAEFCFSQAIEVYCSNRERKTVTKVMKRVNASKRLQIKNRRRISFGKLPPKTIALSSSSTSDSLDYGNCEADQDKTVVSEMTWMDNYANSDYYKQQYMLFLQQEQEKKQQSLFTRFDGNLCSFFCAGPPVYTVEFVEKGLGL